MNLYETINNNGVRTSKHCNVKKCINVQCPHIATLTNTSFEVFTTRTSHSFPFTHCYSGIKLWPCECWWEFLISSWSLCRKHTEDWVRKGDCEQHFQQITTLTQKKECMRYCFTTLISCAMHVIITSHIGLHLKQYVVNKHTPTHPTTKNISLQTFQRIWKLSCDISSAWRS